MPSSRRSAAPPAPPLAGLRFSLVGPGKVGSSVARWLLAAGARLVSVAGGPGRRALPRWAAAAGGRLVPLADLAGNGEDLLLVAVPDARLAEVAATLAERRQAAVALHTSGALGAEALAALAARGTRAGAFHPLRAFPRPLPAAAVARRTFVALDGDAAAVALGARLAAAVGASAAPVPGALRPLYHLAATIAAGGTVTLLATAAALHDRLGVDPASRRGLRDLACGALAAASPDDPGLAITGPVARGEEGYLAQLEALRRAAPEVYPVAVVVALESLRRLAARGPLTPAQQRLREALRDVCAVAGFLDPLLGRV